MNETRHTPTQRTLVYIDRLVEKALITAICVGFGVLGALLAHPYTGGVAGDGRVAVDAIATLIAANLGWDITRSMRNRRRVRDFPFRRAPRVHVPYTGLVPAPRTQHERLTLAGRMAGAHDEQRAAVQAGFRLDINHLWLTNRSLWQWLLDGGASLDLGPGICLVFNADPTLCSADQFSVYTSRSAQAIPVSDARELRSLLEEHARQAGDQPPSSIPA
ncbi:hypothetical protein [Embleya sp. NBC_00896]|uniref:hypothetical protein n=1 Tax=Embleya sp. NBC_00896 TaxID=2975961 RepID=UPI002F909E73|nr:hypothetical protein OG928_48070 [Embleya sp. NBC_00896]